MNSFIQLIKIKIPGWKLWILRITVSLSLSTAFIAIGYLLREQPINSTIKDFDVLEAVNFWIMLLVFAASILGTALFCYIKKRKQYVSLLMLAYLIIGSPILWYYLFVSPQIHFSSPAESGLIRVENKVPAPEGERMNKFTWKYKGRDYNLDLTLYTSYYDYYRNRPTITDLENKTGEEWMTEINNLYLTKVEGDATIDELADRLKTLGEERKFNEDQMVEFVAAFVQAIPYDEQKAIDRFNELSGQVIKITYPYEVLFDNKGVCQDKSYLAYLLLRELGYGVSIFEFPDPKDNHMAVGVKCPSDYSNYDKSGYCFLETTSPDNKLGMVPEMTPQNRIAKSNIEIAKIEEEAGAEDFVPLGQVNILNVSDGNEYKGIIATKATEQKLASLSRQIDARKAELRTLDAKISEYKNEVESYERKLKRENDYDDYGDLYDEYEDLFSKYRRAIKDYNEKIESSNAIVDQYNALNYQFYL